MSNHSTPDDNNVLPDLSSLDLTGGPKPSTPLHQQHPQQNNTPKPAPTTAETLHELTKFNMLPTEVHMAIAEYLRPCDLYEVCQISTRLRKLYEAKNGTLPSW